MWELEREWCLTPSRLPRGLGCTWGHRNRVAHPGATAEAAQVRERQSAGLFVAGASLFPVLCSLSFKMLWIYWMVGWLSWLQSSLGMVTAFLIKSPTFLNNALIYNQAFYPKGQTPYPLEDTLHSRIPSKFSSSDFTFGNCTVTLHLSREIITTVESY